MQVARKSLLVINWTVFGILALRSFSSGADGGIQIGLIFVGLGTSLTLGINWIFADTKN